METVQHDLRSVQRCYCWFIWTKYVERILMFCSTEAKLFNISKPFVQQTVSFVEHIIAHKDTRLQFCVCIALRGLLSGYSKQNQYAY